MKIRNLVNKKKKKTIDQSNGRMHTIENGISELEDWAQEFSKNATKRTKEVR